MSTYLSQYEEHLTALMDRGLTNVSDADVDRLVQEYNQPTSTGLQAWVKEARLACVHCGRPARVEDVRGTDEITCDAHRGDVE